jgi:O-antigen ligase
MRGFLRALTTGIPGLLLTIMWLVVSPVEDIHRGSASGNDPALTKLFVRIWLFSVIRACLESSFFTGGNPCWFMMLVSIFGLRLQGSLVLISEASTQNRPAKIVGDVTVRD